MLYTSNPLFQSDRGSCSTEAGQLAQHPICFCSQRGRPRRHSPARLSGSPACKSGQPSEELSIKKYVRGLLAICAAAVLLLIPIRSNAQKCQVKPGNGTLCLIPGATCDGAAVNTERVGNYPTNANATSQVSPSVITPLMWLFPGSAVG